MSRKTPRDPCDHRIVLDGDSVPARIWQMVVRGQKVLDLGAGSGAISRMLVERKGCRLTALELNDSRAQRLRGFCDRVIQEDLNDPTWVEKILKVNYDYILLG